MSGILGSPFKGPDFLQIDLSTNDQWRPAEWRLHFASWCLCCSQPDPGRWLTSTALGRRPRVQKQIELNRFTPKKRSCTILRTCAVHLRQCCIKNPRLTMSWPSTAVRTSILGSFNDGSMSGFQNFPATPTVYKQDIMLMSLSITLLSYFCSVVAVLIHYIIRSLSMAF